MSERCRWSIVASLVALYPILSLAAMPVCASLFAAEDRPSNADASIDALNGNWRMGSVTPAFRDDLATYADSQWVFGSGKLVIRISENKKTREIAFRVIPGKSPEQVDLVFETTEKRQIRRGCDFYINGNKLIWTNRHIPNRTGLNLGNPVFVLERVKP